MKKFIALILAFSLCAMCFTSALAAGSFSFTFDKASQYRTSGSASKLSNSKTASFNFTGRSSGANATDKIGIQIYNTNNTAQKTNMKYYTISSIKAVGTTGPYSLVYNTTPDPGVVYKVRGYTDRLTTAALKVSGTYTP